MKPLTHEKKLAEALRDALRELEHVKSHGFKSPALDTAIAESRRTLYEYDNECRHPDDSPRNTLRRIK